MVEKAADAHKRVTRAKYDLRNCAPLVNHFHFQHICCLCQQIMAWITMYILRMQPTSLAWMAMKPSFGIVVLWRHLAFWSGEDVHGRKGAGKKYGAGGSER